MPGTSAGLKKAWATRRERYGKSGRAPQTVNKSSRNKSGQPALKSSRNTNKSERRPRDLPHSYALDQLINEREEVLREIRHYDRDRSTGKFPQRYDKSKGMLNQAPEWIIARNNEARRNRHSENVRHLHELDQNIKALTDDLIRQERKKYGRRYS